jgi:dynein light intermediate chain 1
VIDRDKILVPPNWDSWGKIRIIREGFDMEGVSTAWSIEIQDPPEPLTGAVDQPQEDSATGAEDGTSAVAIFEQTITDPKRNTAIAHPGSQNSANKIEVETLDMQSFLAKQLEVLEQLKLEDEKDRATKQVPHLEMSPLEDNGRVNEHIGPVQFNMGGIQVDADDMLRKLKVSCRINLNGDVLRTFC